MELNKITLMEAYLIETLRYHEVTNEQLLTTLESGDISGWNHFNDNFNFKDLITLRNQDPSVFQEIIYEGYTIKFLTFNGLKNMLRLKFNKLPEKDFTVTEKGIKHLVMTDPQLTSLKQILSSNWIVT